MEEFMSEKFDVFQQTFALSLLSNLASGYRAKDLYIPGPDGDPLEVQLANNIAVALPMPVVSAGLGNDWKMVWGPAVWRRENAAVVFYNPEVTFEDGTTAPTYVVAIAATNFISGYDWVMEDFTVSSTVNWTQYHPAEQSHAIATNGFLTPVISQGTATGVGQIAKLTPTDPANGKISLSAFIKQINGSVREGTRIVFTGHSLAGALAPTFALYLKEQGALSKFERVNVYPTAGASPGNNIFSNRFADAFPRKAAGGKAWQNWNVLIRNQYDIVPHAWDPQTLLQLLTIYGNSVSDSGVKIPAPIHIMVLAALAESSASKILYAALPSAELQSESPEGVPETAGAYLAMALIQHVQIYISEILGPDFLSIGHAPTVPGVIEVMDAEHRIAEIIKILDKIIHPGTAG
jgi:hypothetical protein